MKKLQAKLKQALTDADKFYDVVKIDYENERITIMLDASKQLTLNTEFAECTELKFRSKDTLF